MINAHTVVIFINIYKCVEKVFGSMVSSTLIARLRRVFCVLSTYALVVCILSSDDRRFSES